MKTIFKNKLMVVVLGCAVVAFAGFGLAGCSSSSTPAPDPAPPSTLTLTSNDITSGAEIGLTYVLTTDCGGSDTSPQLTWSGDLPSGTLSFAVTVLDQSNSDFVHWSVYNIPTTVTSIARGASAEGIGTGVAFGPNSYPPAYAQQYDGPCPPTGEQHTYQFKVWALDIANLMEDMTINFNNPTSVVTGISSHAVSGGTASFTATYTGP